MIKAISLSKGPFGMKNLGRPQRTANKHRLGIDSRGSFILPVHNGSKMSEIWQGHLTKQLAYTYFSTTH